MKIRKIIFGVATAAIAIVGSFAFKANANKKFGAGTLFSKTSSTPCHAISCQRTTGTSSCSSPAPYYTTISCANTVSAAVDVAL